MWLLFAVLSSLFAALTSILAKIGIDGVNSNLATAIRTFVVPVMAWGMVFLTNAQTGMKSWVFLILSGLATGASWLCLSCWHFCSCMKMLRQNPLLDAS